MSIWTEWGDNWNDSYKKHQQYNTQLNNTEQALGPKAKELANRYEQLEALTPNETPELLLAAVDMNLTDEQYLEIWSETKNEELLNQNNRSERVNREVQGHYNSQTQLYLQLNADVLGNINPSTLLTGAKEGLKTFKNYMGSYFFNGSRIFLEPVIQNADKAFFNYNLEYSASLEKILNQEGKTLEDSISIAGYENLKDNDTPIAAALLAHFEAQKIYRSQKKKRYKNGLPYYDASTQAKQFMIARGLVDDEGNPLVRKTDLDIYMEIFPDYLAENLEQEEQILGRELSFSEKTGLYLKTINDIINPDTEQTGFAALLSSAPEFDENRSFAQDYMTTGLPVTIGDGITYSLIGNLSASYGPGNQITELVDNQYLAIESEAQNLLSEGRINGTTYYEILDEATVKRNNLIQDIGYKKEYSMAGFLAGTVNVGKYIYLDLANAIVPGSGIVTQSYKNMDEALTILAKSLPEELDKGKTLQNIYDANADVFEGLAEILVSAKDNGVPVGLKLINAGLHPDFAFKVQNADTTIDDVVNIMQDGIQNGYVADLFYGGRWIGRGKNKHLQSKVLNENLLAALSTPLDDGIATTVRRGGTFREQMLAQDIKLPKTKPADLNDIQESLRYFTRYGYLGSVPEQRIGELATEFYNALKDGKTMEAKRIFKDKLVYGEIGLQLKTNFGFADNEIDDFFNKFYNNDAQGFDDTFAKPMSPSRNPEFYPLDEVDIITQKQFSDVASEEQMIQLTQNSLELYSQLKNLTIHGPDIQGMIKATSNKRRLRNKYLNAEGNEEIFEVVRKAADEGEEINFWKEGSHLNELLADIKPDFENPNVLFKSVEGISGGYDRFFFGFMRNFQYPAYLLGRISYPLKLQIDGMIKFKMLGVKGPLDGLVDYFKLMLNDSEGLLARVFKINPDTTMVGPYRTTKPLDNKATELLGDVIPKSVRKALGILSDSQEFGTTELAQLFSADVKFVDNQLMNITGHDLVTIVDTVKHPKAFVYFLDRYIEDPLANIISGMKRKGFTIEQMADYLKNTESIRKIIQKNNDGLIKRGPASRNAAAAAIKTDEDYIRLATHYSQSIDNYTGGSLKLLDVIADAKIGNINLRNLDILQPGLQEQASRKIIKLYNEVKDKVPAEIPFPKGDKKSLAEQKSVIRNLLDSMFFATSQGEGSVIRIPFIKQAYNLAVDAFTNFGQKSGLEEMLKVHLDPDTAINLNKEVVKSVKDNIKRAGNTLADYDEVLNVNIKPTISKNTANGVTEFVVTLFTEQGQKTVDYLSTNARNADSITFTTDVQKAEAQVYGAANKIAEGRLGFDDSKVGTYISRFNKNEIIYNGQFDNEKIVQDVLLNAYDIGYAAEDVALIIKDAVKYLSEPGANKKGLEKILGLSGNKPNLLQIRRNFQASTKGKTQKAKYTGEQTFDVGRKTIEKVLNQPVRIAVPKKALNEELTNSVYRFVRENPEGFSLDLGNQESWGQIASLFVSPYNTRTLVVSGKNSLTPNVLKSYILDNGDKLRLTDHVLGGRWDEARGQWFLDVSVKINRGVKDTTINASKKAYDKAKYLGLAADQVSFGEVYLIKEGDEIIESIFKYDDTYEIINNGAVYNTLRLRGNKLLTDNQVKALGEETIVTNPGYLQERQGLDVTEKAIVADNIFEKLNIKGIFNRKEKTMEIFKPADNTIMPNMNEWSYTSLLDMNDVRANIVRNMSFEDIHQRAMDFAMEAQTNLLFNLTERGYFAQAYRSAFAFFEAWREYNGRYYLLSKNNMKAAYQVAEGYRKGVENNVIFKDKFGDNYLFIPTGGTPLDSYAKSNGFGEYTEDASVPSERVYVKRSLRLSALGVGGAGVLPSLGAGMSMPVGFLLRDKPSAKRFVERYIMAGYSLPFSGKGEIDLLDIPEEFIRGAIPSVAQNWFNAMAEDFNIAGVDEDIWLGATTKAFQISAQLHPELGFEALETVTGLVRENIYTLMTYDRFVSPFAPKLNVLYAIEGNPATFKEWYDEEGFESGIFYNNMVELGAIHGFYQSMRSQWVATLGPTQGEYYALVEVVRLLGLDKYGIQGFTSAGLQIKGRSVSEAGRVPRTTLEYDFVLSHPELAKDFGPVLTYFSRNLDEGLLDFGGFNGLPVEQNTPKNEQEMFADVQKFLASVIGKSMKEEKLRELEATIKNKPDSNFANIVKAENARIDSWLATMFPIAYGRSEAYNSVLGGETAERLNNDVMIDYLTRAAENPEFQEFELTGYLQEYFAERTRALDAIRKKQNYPNIEQAVSYLKNNTSPGADAVRTQLQMEAFKIIEKYPLFMVVYDEVLVNEIDRFGVID